MVVQKKAVSLHRNSEKWFAQMAESVDALVSNTSGFTSIPVRPRVWVQKERNESFSPFFVLSFNWEGLLHSDHRKMDHRKIYGDPKFHRGT